MLNSLYFPQPEAEGAEKLFCIELDEVQCRNIEPDREKLFGDLLSTAMEDTAPWELGEKAAELPMGDYLFAQRREILSKEDIAAMAVEIQAEGLWQRLELDRKLYLRYLFEDGCWVTQLFRPYKSRSGGV